MLLWRGDGLEAEMHRFLAGLYFRNKDYRNGFETVKQAVAYHPESPAANGPHCFLNSSSDPAAPSLSR